MGHQARLKTYGLDDRTKWINTRNNTYITVLFSAKDIMQIFNGIAAVTAAFNKSKQMSSTWDKGPNKALLRHLRCKAVFVHVTWVLAVDQEFVYVIFLPFSSLQIKRMFNYHVRRMAICPELIISLPVFMKHSSTEFISWELIGHMAFLRKFCGACLIRVLKLFCGKKKRNLIFFDLN